MAFRIKILLILLGALVCFEKPGKSSEALIEDIDNRAAVKLRKHHHKRIESEIRSTNMWRIFYSNAGGILDILSTLGTATTTILVAIDVAQTGASIRAAYENGECPTCKSTLAIAAAATGAASLALNVLAKGAQKAAESKRKSYKKLLKENQPAQNNQNDNSNNPPQDDDFLI